MSIFEVIEQRRSVFPNQFNNKPIEKAELDKILASANWAPNHKHTEPWRFKVVQGNAKLKLAQHLVVKQTQLDSKMSSFKQKKITSKFEQAHTVIAICIKRHSRILPEWEEVAAVAMAVQNMWLACTELNIGSYWSSPSLITLVDDFFNLEDGESCLGFFYMGKFDMKIDEGKRKSSIDDKVEYFTE